MPKLTIVAHITAKPDKIAHVKASLQSIIAPTLAEQGCLQYDLHQDNENPAHFMFYENWESRDLWQDHMKSAHLATHIKRCEDAVAGVVIHEMATVE